MKESQLEKLLDDALDGDEGALLERARAAGLSRRELLAHLKSRLAEIESVPVPAAEAEEEEYERAVQAATQLGEPRRRLLRRLEPPRVRRERAQIEEGLRNAKYRRDRAWESVRSSAQLESVRGFIRAYINSNQEARYSTILGVVEHEGLAETDDIRWAIDTDARRRLDWLLEHLPGGSIGLAGPRGAGKSTLMRAACADSPPEQGDPTDIRHPFSVLVAAPVKFDPRDFILHLFAEVCQALLGRAKVEAMRQPREELAGSYMRRLLWLIGPPLAIITGVLLTLQATVSVDSQLIWGPALFATGFAVMYLAWFMRLRERRRVWRFEGDVRDRLEDRPSPEAHLGRTRALARNRLMDIWFQQSFTSGWSGSLKLPIGIDAGLEGSRELAKQQMSLPDVVSELRRLVRDIAVVRPVRIGIDELDKIESPEAAWRFMNEIKVLFMIPNCFFLVSVSEDAMSMFQRRGLPFRDVFDSSFDDVVPVGYLDARSAIALLERRIVGLRVPFALLCHCMAGGLARDLIRAAREMLTLSRQEPPESTLSNICNRLVSADVTVKARAAIVACRGLQPGPRLEALLAWLNSAIKEEWTPQALVNHIERAEHDLGPIIAAQKGPQPHEEVMASTKIAREFAAFCLFSATLLEYFVTDRSFDPSQPAEAQQRSDDLSAADHLVQARQSFAIDVRLAWAAMVSFRESHGMSPARLPAFDGNRHGDSGQ